MSEGNFWMTVYVTSLLVTAGIPLNSISWNARAGEDEIDIRFILHGVTVFFELKDKNFSLSHAYSLVGRLTRYGGSVGVVVTTGFVEPSALAHLEERRTNAGIPIEVVSGLSGARKKFDDLIFNISASEAKTQLSRILGSTAGVKALEAWLSKENEGERLSEGTLGEPRVFS